MARLWIRADASARMGIGHVMRTLACAEEAARRGISVEYVMSRDTQTNTIPGEHGYKSRIIHQPHDRSWTMGVTRDDVVLFDGYHFGRKDFAIAKETGAAVAAVDDFGNGRYPVDVLVNQNLDRRTHYVTNQATKVLLGPAYAMVRSEFRKRQKKRTYGLDSLVIVFGGSDTASLSTRATYAALDSPFKRILVIVGPAASFSLPSTVRSVERVHVVKSPTSIAHIFDQASAAVSASGATTWELLCMGVPTAFVEVSDNQKGTAAAVARKGAALFAGRANDVATTLPTVLERLASRQLQETLSMRSMELVDGLGARRIIDTLYARPNTT